MSFFGNIGKKAAEIDTSALGQKKNPETTEVVFSDLKKLIEEGPPIVKLILTNAEGRVSRITQLLEQIRKAMENNTKNQDDVTRLTAEISALTKQITEKDAEIAKLMKEATDSSSQSQKDKDRISELEEKLSAEKKSCTTKMKELVTQLTSANNKMKADKDLIEKKYGELEDQVKGLSEKATLTKSSYSDATFNSGPKQSSTSTFGKNTSTTQPISVRGRKPATPQTNTNKRPAWNSSKTANIKLGGKRRRTKKGRKSRRGRKTRKH